MQRRRRGRCVSKAFLMSYRDLLRSDSVLVTSSLHFHINMYSVNLSRNLLRIGHRHRVKRWKMMVLEIILEIVNFNVSRIWSPVAVTERSRMVVPIGDKRNFIFNLKKKKKQIKQNLGIWRNFWMSTCKILGGQVPRDYHMMLRNLNVALQ